MFYSCVLTVKCVQITGHVTRKNAVLKSFSFVKYEFVANVAIPVKLKRNVSRLACVVNVTCVTKAPSTSTEISSNLFVLLESRHV